MMSLEPASELKTLVKSRDTVSRFRKEDVFRLILRTQVEIAVADEPIGEVEERIVDRMFSTVYWKAKLATTIASNFRCQAVVAIDQASDEGSSSRRRRYLKVVGITSDVDAAAAAYEAAKQAIEVLSRQWLTQQYTQTRHSISEGLTMKSMWAEEFVNELDRRLRAQIQNSDLQKMLIRPDSVSRWVERYRVKPAVTSISSDDLLQPSA